MSITALVIHNPPYSRKNMASKLLNPRRSYMTFRNAYRFVAVLALVISCAYPALAQISTAKVIGGIVEGVVKDGIASFKGIPFAAPPVGELRWKPPQPVMPWKGVRKADGFGPAPIQDAGAMAVLDQLVKLGLLQPKFSENCLYLNVWTGAKKTNEKRPVMFWIHGGGFTRGMATDLGYDGTNFARKGVVLVSVAYRLGVLGFLAHPELSKESGKGSGNYGILDQIAGLKWVKENVAQFGGDPSNVTIFGQSAGGLAVAMLNGSPLAQGLFHRAISESGGAPAATSLKTAEEKGMVYLEKLGAHDLKAARALSPEVLQKGTEDRDTTTLVVDGEAVVAADRDELLTGSRYTDMPILVGTNSMDGNGISRLLLIMSKRVPSPAFEQMIRGIMGVGGWADPILRAYLQTTEAKAARDLCNDLPFAWPAWAWAKLQSKGINNKVYVYYFDHRTPSSPDGANHSAEVLYVFGNLNLINVYPDYFGAGVANGPEDKAISDLVSSYWVNFAKKGDPNGPGLPVWPVFDRKEYATMVFDETPSAREYPHLDKMKVFESYYSAQKTK
jgi:para-nitrobenzyl esterase